MRLTSARSLSALSRASHSRPPDHLDDVPAGALELGLQLLDDLAVPADRAVEALQVAVHDERQVVEPPLVGRELEHAARLRLVHLAVAEERPDVLLAGVLDAAVVQVLVRPRLVDRRRRAEAHGDRRELPEVRQHARVRVRGQAAAGVRLLLAEPVERLRRHAALEEAAGVLAGGGVPPWKYTWSPPPGWSLPRKKWLRPTS